MISLLCVLAFAEITIDPPPVSGTPSVVTVTNDAGRPVSGVSVRATSRPGLAGEAHASLGLTDSLGRVQWSPESGGDAIVRVGDEVQPVRIGFVSPPPATLAHLGVLLSGSLLCLAFGIRRRTS